jgi:30S ribosomal protein S31
MGKGDKKTKRGKILMGSYGVRRKKRKSARISPLKEIAEVKPVAPVKEKATAKARAEKEEVVVNAPDESAPVTEAAKPARKKAPPKASSKKEEKAAE